MGRLKTGAMRVFGAVVMLLLVCGCGSTQGGLGIEWGSQQSDGYSEGRGVPKKGPPPHAPAHGYRAKHSYRYYPSREVYYDTGRRIYFYIENGLWKSGVSLPYHLQVDLGGFQTVEIYSDTPYAHHEKIQNRGQQNGYSPKAKKK
ncbi:MAG TPA: hypothetical protein VK852_13105 [Desulfobacterales bacterium]|jgi:hypothetical protein|nr:hypothetical protein [Desulfobacterales bacterium]